jgi:hypothetical protein
MKVGHEPLKEEIMAGLKIQIGCLTSRIHVNQENCGSLARRGPGEK